MPFQINIAAFAGGIGFAALIMRLLGRSLQSSVEVLPTPYNLTNVYSTPGGDCFQFSMRPVRPTT